MLKFIDRVIDRITMYRLVLYYLLALLGWAMILGLFGLLPYSPLALLASLLLFIAVCWLANTIFAWAFEAPTNVESLYITALILVLIVTPPTLATAWSFFWLAFWLGTLAMASKYILAIGKKHLFNPVAIAAALLALSTSQSASWWVGTTWLAPLVLLGGLILIRKLRRFDLIGTFFLVATAGILVLAWFQGSNLLTTGTKTFLTVPILFFAFAMLSEPLTTPPTRVRRIIYGAITGLFFALAIRIGSNFSTPELALVAANLFSYLLSSKTKLILSLKDRIQTGVGAYDFVFVPDQALQFRPGQYLEWTLGHPHPDTRGNRRFFTIASSPTEPDLRLGVKFYDQPSSFKQTLGTLQTGQKIIASQLAGDFVLPADPKEKLVFIAGGIGITPFRSMIKYLLDRRERRDIVLLYSNKIEGEIIYRDVFDEAVSKLGLKAVYTLTEIDQIPTTWTGRRGFLDSATIVAEVPDYRQRTFYISGPQAMVSAFRLTLRRLGVPARQIKTDFFPGLA